MDVETARGVSDATREQNPWPCRQQIIGALALYIAVYLAMLDGVGSNFAVAQP
jgi:hypothetical protein